MNHAGLIRVPVHTAERIRKVLFSRTALQQQLGHEPTAGQIADHSGIEEKKVLQLLQLIPEVCSLDAPAGEDDSSLQLLLEDLQAPQPQEELVRRELNHTLHQLMGMLDERQQQVLRLHFGMDDGICHSLEQIGNRLQISKERARQIERQAMDKLKKLGADLGLEEFLE